MKKIVVTGATSMLGAALVGEALKRGSRVFAVVRPDTPRIGRLPQDEKLHTVYSRIDKIGGIDVIPADCDVFYHFAWEGASKEKRDDPSVQAENIIHTLQSVRLAARTCRKFVGAGSQAEYGRQEDIGAETVCMPESAYGIAKYSAGQLGKLLCKQSGLDFVWARVCSVYGVNDNSGTMVDYAVSSFLRKEKAYFSDGMQKWNYLYEKDAGVMFYLLGEKNLPDKEYIIAHEKSRLLREYVEDIADLLNAKELCSFSGDTGRDKKGLNPDISATVHDLGYTPQTGFREGIREILKARRL